MIECVTKKNLEEIKKSLNKKGITNEVKEAILKKIDLIENNKTVNK